MSKFLILVFMVSSVAHGNPEAGLVPTNTILSDEAYTPIFLGKEFSGADSVGGGDTVDARKHAAWFYGNAPINVCFHVTQNFGLNEKQIQDNLTKVSNNWKTYFKQKELNHGIDTDKVINQNFNFKNECEGGEDLVLYFGTGPIFGNLNDLRARQYLTRPVAYVNKTHIAEDLKWSKGYIRFVEPFLYQYTPEIGFPDWTKNSAFYNILFHEWGHLLGFDHREDTIMDRDIAPKQFVTNGITTALKVDGLKELVPCKTCFEYYRSVENTIGIDLVKIIDRRVEFTNTQGHTFGARATKTVYGDSYLPLFSFFQTTDYRQWPRLGFFAYYEGLESDDKFLFVHKTEKGLRLVKAGEVVGTYEKVEE